MSILILGTIPAAPISATFSGSRTMHVGTNDAIAVDPGTGSNADGRQVFELLVQALPSDVTLDTATWEGNDLSVDAVSGATVLPHTFDGSHGLILRVPDYRVAWGASNTLAVSVTRSGVDPGPLTLRVDEFFLGGISGGTLDIATWGANARGQLLDGTLVDNGEPAVNRTQVASVAGGAGDPTWVTLAGSGADGSGTYGAGDNSGGQLSQGAADGTPHATPLLLLRNSKWAGHEDFTYPLHFDQLAFGFDHAVGIDDHRRVWPWGRGDRGQLGDGTSTDSAFPTLMSRLVAGVATAFGAVQALPCDGFTVLVRAGTTDLWVVGTVPGIGTYDRPHQISADTGWFLPPAGHCSAPRHCIALNGTDSTFYAFGSNEYGQCLTGAASAAIGLTSVMPQVPSAGVTNGLPALGPDGTLWIQEDQNVEVPDRFKVMAAGKPHPLGDGAGLGPAGDPFEGLEYSATPTRIPFPDLIVNPDNPAQRDSLTTGGSPFCGRGHRLAVRQRPWGLVPTDPDEIAATDPADFATTWWSQGWDDHGQRGLGDVGGGYGSAFELFGGTPATGFFAVTGAVGWDSNWARLLPVERGAPWAQWVA